MDKKYTFLKKAEIVHGNKYDYSKVDYINGKTKICIICPEHGEFWQEATSHLCGRGCPKCAKKHRPTTEEWVEKAVNAHGNKYDYSKVEYVDSATKVCIICPEHGEFWQTPMNHVNGKGCSMCSGNKKLTTEEFIKKCEKNKNNKYDYSKVNYINTDVKVCIICPEHGEFWQTPYKHLIKGQGCPKCYGTFKVSNEEFIKKAKTIHNNKYDYSKVDYKNNHTKVCIICPEHGEFWQTPLHHLNRKQGCPKCNESKLENTVREILESKEILYEKEKTFEWLRNEKPLRLDFYLPKFNIGIECQGIQHYMPVDFGNKGDEWATENFEKIQFLDKLKNNLCKKNGIKIIYIKYNSKKIEGKIFKILETYKK